MDRRKLAAVAMSAGVVAALATPAGANAAPDFDSAPPTMVEAVQRDLGITEAEAAARLASDSAAIDTEEALRAGLGASYGGSWINDAGDLVVGITDASQADQVRAAGAFPRLVANSENELNSTMTTLDRADRPSPDDVHGWQVDVTTNSVVVLAAPGATVAAAEFVEASGIDADSVRVEVSTEAAPEPLFNVFGGYPYFPGQFRCSIGFSVVGGFVTAGHCGDEGTTTDGYNGAAQGVVAGSSFPGNDYGWVSVNSNWDPRGFVYRWDGSFIGVDGHQVAPIGALVCRSGSTTGYHCGNITHRNRTVNYPQGTVFGLTRTTVCAEGGDSGGSFIAAGINAQGVTSGGSGNCTSGGITFFQPVNEILNVFNLTLVTE